jgi:predicted nuclease of predicted toxin-antitoxin system
VKILLDENITPMLARALKGHECVHVSKIGWSGRKNGLLLSSAEAEGFQVILTLDAGIPHQHSFKNRKIAVAVLRPKSQGVSALMELVPVLLDQLESIQPGSQVQIKAR